MISWPITPWTIQYLIGGFVSLFLSGYILYKNFKSKACQFFFLFGVFVSLWEFFAFLHRNALTSSQSLNYLRVDFFFLALAPAFLLLSTCYIYKRRIVYYLILVPALFLGMWGLLMVPFEIVSSVYGWSYKFPPGSTSFMAISILYVIAILVILFYMTIKASLLLRKKHVIILVGFTVFYVIGTIATNLALQMYPNFPPLGGLLTFITFLFIAYAISLPVEEITLPPGKPLEILADDWLRFLRKLREVVPGRELGEDVPRFDDALKSMGLSDVVRYEKGELIFNSEQLTPLGINEIVWATTDFMRKTDWALPAIKEYTNVFVNIYKTVSETDKKAADGWLDTMICKYGGFLDKQGVLDAMPEDAKIPEIFKELKERRTYLFKEERPVKAYEKLKEALSHGFECLTISKLEPRRVKERYDVGKASIFWLTFKETENAINPKRLDHLKRTVSEFVKSSSRSVVLLDCFDQIILANGFEKSRSMLREIKDLCMKNNANLLLSVNPGMFEKEQMATIEKELKEVKV
ncbi:MAG: DUF835 domain-containing protein [Thermoplasmatales archaeon]|nr:DUF835 domain-containing protein [Candidatus Thermoplasmatota archaeon]MCG2825678.1 DUF835 domain-containing protein [Thermoplasmatales archaeon]